MLVPVEDAAGFAFETVHPIPAGAPTIAQLKATIPVKPFNPFTSSVSVMFVPTLVETIGVFAVRVKSLTASVTFVERARLFSAALVPTIAIVAFAIGVETPTLVASVTTDCSGTVTPGVTTGGLGVQLTPAGSAPQLTVMSCVMPPSGVNVMV